MRLALVLLAATVAMSCRTPGEPATTELPEAVRGEVVAHIRAGNPESAIQRISALRRQEILPRSDLDSLYSDAVTSIVSSLGDAVGEERYDDAIRLFRNLVALGEEPPEQLDLNALYLSDARSHWQRDDLPAAVATMMRAPQLSAMPPESIEVLAQAALSLNDRNTLRVLLEIMGPEWRRDHPAIVEAASSGDSPIRMVDGTVTIWVNRGIRLEGGVGYPDRVIGSGFFVDPRGYIITNHHIIQSEVDPEYEGYSRLYVRLPRNPERRIPARVVGYDRIFDIALLKVEIDAPYVFSLTDIRSLEPGSRIIAIGSPGGLENSISSGIISATGRRFLQLGDAMQVDVPINPGNSGGPLLDTAGNVVGVVFAGIEQFEGVNFAIPSFWIHPHLPELYEGGEVSHPWIGVSVHAAGGGLEVTYVANDSPADVIGLAPGDIVTKIGDWGVERIGPGQRAVIEHEPGAILPITWKRGGETVTGLVALAKRPFSPVAEGLKRDLHERLFPVLYGMDVRRSGVSILGREFTVTRVYPGGIADETGMTSGDVFTERGFEVDEESRLAILRIVVRKRTEGFLETGLQIPAYLETDTFL